MLQTGEIVPRARDGCCGIRQRVQIEEPIFRVSDYLWSGSIGVVWLIGQAITVLFLVFFLLASGDLYKRKLVEVVGPRLSRQKLTIQILNEIDRMRASEVTDAELSLATSYLDGVFPIRFESTAAIASALASLVSYGLPDDYFDRYRENIRSVTAAEVLRVARAYVRPEELQVVAVGDAAAVRGPLEQLGLGPVQVYDAEGNPAA